MYIVEMFFILSEYEIFKFMTSFLLKKKLPFTEFFSLVDESHFFLGFFFSVHGLITDWHYLFIIYIAIFPRPPRKNLSQSLTVTGINWTLIQPKQGFSFHPSFCLPRQNYLSSTPCLKPYSPF